MKKLILVMAFLVMGSVSVYAMASNPKEQACYKTESCINVWQCYGASVQECQDKAKAQVNPKLDPRKYWDLVGECQAEYCQ